VDHGRRDLEPDLSIRQLSTAEVIPLRHAILRAGLPRSAALFPDDDAAETRHFGAFDHDALVGVVSIYHNPLPEEPENSSSWQLRGMASSLRGRGFGRALLHAGVSYVAEQGGSFLWCNARKPAVGFYSRHGWRVLGDEFEISTAGPHFRMGIAVQKQED
jgi:predicted GNAT family N-acyltransferase